MSEMTRELQKDLLNEVLATLRSLQIRCMHAGEIPRWVEECDELRVYLEGVRADLETEE